MFISFRDLKVKTRLWLSFSLLSSFIVMMGTMTVVTFNEMAATTAKLYKHPMTVGRAIRDVRTDLHRGRILMLKLALVSDSATLNTTTAELKILHKQIDEGLAIAKERFLGDMREIDKLSDEFAKLEQLREEIIELIKAGKKEQAIEQIVSGINAKQVDEIEKSIEYIVSFGNEKAMQFVQEAEMAMGNTYWWVSSIIIISIILTVWIVTRTAGTISRSLGCALTVANAVRDGNLNNHIGIISRDEIGQLLSALDSMQTQLKERSESDKRIAEEINVVTSTASQGDFSKRVALEGKTGTFKIMSESINHVLEFNQLAIKDLTSPKEI